MNVSDVERLIQLAGEATSSGWSYERSGDALYLNRGTFGIAAAIWTEETEAEFALAAAAVNLAVPLAQEWLRLKAIEEAARLVSEESWFGVRSEGSAKLLDDTLAAVGVETEE